MHGVFAGGECVAACHRRPVRRSHRRDHRLLSGPVSHASWTATSAGSKRTRIGSSHSHGPRKCGRFSAGSRQLDPDPRPPSPAATGHRRGGRRLAANVKSISPLQRQGQFDHLALAGAAHGRRRHAAVRTQAIRLLADVETVAVAAREPRPVTSRGDSMARYSWRSSRQADTCTRERAALPVVEDRPDREPGRLLPGRPRPASRRPSPDPPLAAGAASQSRRERSSAASAPRGPTGPGSTRTPPSGSRPATSTAFLRRRLRCAGGTPVLHPAAAISSQPNQPTTERRFRYQHARNAAGVARRIGAADKSCFAPCRMDRCRSHCAYRTCWCRRGGSLHCPSGPHTVNGKTMRRRNDDDRLFAPSAMPH